jgi:hypothetical protein
MVELEDGSEFVIDTEVMTDNLILSVEGRQSNASGFRLLSVPNSPILIIILVLIELLRLHLE